MRHLFFVLFILLSSSYSAQSETQNTETSDEVNRTLWRSFKLAYDSKDAKAFNALHTDDVMRVSPWGIKIGDEYKKSNESAFSMSPERQQSIDFAMEHRIYDDKVGYEVGFYRIVYTIDDEVVHTSYARFHVRLRKENNQWKIAQDWDIDHINGEKITVLDFKKADLLELSN